MTNLPKKASQCDIIMMCMSAKVNNKKITDMICQSCNQNTFSCVMIIVKYYNNS